MRFKNLHPFLFLLFFVWGTPSFSQSMLCIQALGGNNTYINPQTPVGLPAPAFELNILGSNNYDESSTGNWLMQVGLKYNRAFQEYTAPGFSGKFHVKITEWLFNISVGKEFRFDEHAITILFGVVEGPTYAETNEPYINNSAQQLTPLGTSDNNRNFIQFYASGAVLYSYNFTKRMSFILGPRFNVFLFNDDVGALGMKGNGIWYNYAPYKLSLSAGINIKISR